MLNQGTKNTKVVKSLNFVPFNKCYLKVVQLYYNVNTKLTLAQHSLAAGSADDGLEVEKRVWEKNSSGQHNGSCMQV